MGAHLLKTSKRSKPLRIVAGLVTVSGGTPAITAGEDFTIADTAAGKVTITLSRPGKAIVSALASCIESTDATGYYAKIMSASASAVVIGTYKDDGTDGVLTDNIPFAFQIMVRD